MKPKPDSPEFARDPVGGATLERMSQAPAYNGWMYDRISRWVGQRVLEIGSGLGNLSQYFIDRDRVVLTDTDAEYREELRRQFGGDRRQSERRVSNEELRIGHRSGHDRRAKNIDVLEFTLPTVPAELQGERFDTIICLNVLEHIEDDLGSLRTMRELLRPEGNLVLLVPALPSIYGTLDRALGHFRRYTPSLLKDCCKEAGLAMHHLEYFNIVGILGWFWAGRIKRSDTIPLGPLTLYNKLVPLFRLERFVPFRVGMSLIAVGRPAS
jgi:SAM-dependent methyltransferase